MATPDQDVIQATPEFRKTILAVLIYTDWLVRYGTVIKPEYFQSDDEKEFVSWVNEYFADYNDVPSEKFLHHGLNGNGILDGIIACTDEDLRYAADVAMDFAQVQAMKVAIIESVDDVTSGELQNPLDRVRQAMRVGKDRLGLGMDLVDDIESWVYSELHGRRFPTGWRTIDNILGGGLVAGEYGFIMAPPGRGKTTALINIGYSMAGLMGAANVLHVTYEMPEQKCLKRYAARVAGVRLMRSHGAEKRFMSDLRKKAKQLMRGHLRVVKPDGQTVDDIRRTIDNLAAEDFATEALIVDYPDLMQSLRRRKEYRFELAEIARDLRFLGEEYEMPVWGASQARREAVYKEVIHITDVAEAIEKAAIADIVISVCQTKEEEKLGHGRLFLAKIRDAEDKFVVPVRMDFSSQAIVERGGRLGS